MGTKTERRLLGAVGVALLVGVCMFVFWGPPSAQSSRQDSVQRDGAKRLPESGLAASRTGPQVRPLDAQSSDVEHEMVAATEAAGWTGKRLLRGSIVVVEQDGRTRKKLSGTLTLIVWNGGAGTFKDVVVRDGLWATEINNDRSVSARRARLGDRVAAVTFAKTRPPKDGRIDLSARWRMPSVLVVVDAQLKRPLGDIEIARRKSWRGWDAMAVHPGMENERVLIARAERTPFQFPESSEGVQVYWIRAPEYAWTRIEIDHSVGGERQVELVRSGSLEVSVSDLPIDQRLFVRVRSAQGDVLAEAAARQASPSTFENLRAGSYVVSLERGVWKQADQELALASVTVVPGERARVTLAGDGALANAPSVMFAGTLRIERNWRVVQVPRVRMSGTPGVSMSPAARVTRESDGLWRWEVELQRASTYSATVAWDGPGACHAKFELGQFESGSQRVELEVPAPVGVILTFVDSQGRNVPVNEVDELDWLVVGSSGLRASSARRVGPSTENGVFRFRAISGALHVHLLGSRFLSPTSKVALKPGANSARVELHLRPAIRLRERESGRDLPETSGARVAVRRVGEARWRTRSAGLLTRQESGAMTVYVDSPGTYDIVVERGRYKPHRSRIIVKPDTAVTHLEIEYQLRE